MCFRYKCKGASIYLKDGTVKHHEGFKVKAIDTTGAGDAFIGAVISQILKPS
jgi:fructokinase